MEQTVSEVKHDAEQRMKRVEAEAASLRADVDSRTAELLAAKEDKERAVQAMEQSIKTLRGESESIRAQAAEETTRLRQSSIAAQDDFDKKNSAAQARIEELAESLAAQSKQCEYYVNATSCLLSVLHPLRCAHFDLKFQKRYLHSALMAANKYKETERQVADLVHTLAEGGALRLTVEEACAVEQARSKHRRRSLRAAGIAILAFVRFRRGVGSRYGKPSVQIGRDTLFALPCAGSDVSLAQLYRKHLSYVSQDLEPVNGIRIAGVGSLLSAFKYSMQSSLQPAQNVASALRRSVGDLTGQMRALHIARETVAREAVAMSQRLRQAESDRASSQAEAVALKDALGALEARVEAINADHMRSVSEEKFREVVERCSDISSELEAERDLRKEDNAAAAEVKRALQAHVDAAISAEQSMRVLQEQNRVLRKDLDALKERSRRGEVAQMSLARLNDTIMQERQRAADAERRATTLEVEASDCERRLAAANSEKDTSGQGPCFDNLA